MANNIITFEDELKYLVDIVESDKPKNWDKAVKDLGLSINPCSLRKAFNTTKFSGYQVAKYYENKTVEYASDEIIEKYEAIKDEVYKERCKYQDIVREKRKYLREEARFENLVEVLKECVSSIEESEKSIHNTETTKTETKEASLLLSDIHIGLEVDNVLNYYSVDVAKERMDELCNKTIQKCKENNISKLNVEILGDLISGSIQVSAKTDHEEDVISQIITVSDILSNFINRLNREINEIVVYGVCGNHSRIDQNKKNSVNRENYERLIFEYIKIRVPYVKLIQNGYEDFLSYKVGDKEVVICHGDKDSLFNAKNHYANVLKRVVDEIHFGHVHHFSSNDDNGTMVISNGSVISTDNYAVGLRCNTKAYQVLRIYGEDDEIYRLMLK